MVHQFWRKIQRFWNAELSRTIFATAAAHSNFISVGIIQGYSAVMLPQLDVTDNESSWIAGLGVISTPLGALIAGVLVDYIGRRRVLFLPNLLFFVSWILIGFAPEMSLIYIGRALGGFAAGMTTSSYLYVIEISRAHHRGVLSAFGPVFVSVGVLMVYTMGFLFEWPKVAFLSSLACLFSVILIYTVPDSPTWYASKQQPEKAFESLKWLRRDTKCAEMELKTLVEAFAITEKQDCGQQNQETTFKNMAVITFLNIMTTLTKPDVWKPFLILIFFFFFQIGSGIYVMLFYSVQIFQQFGTNYNENVVTVAIGVLRLLMAILGAILMTKFGRRQLSIFSGIFMSLALLVVSSYLAAMPLMSHPYHIVPVICICFHVGFSMTGFLQIPFILSSELYPASCRGVMGGISCSLGYVLVFISVKMYPDLLALVAIEGVMWSFFCLTVTGVIFLLMFLPETKDKTFEEISDSFCKNINSNNQAKKCDP